MMWDVVIPAWLAILEADADLMDELGLDSNGLIPIYSSSSSRKAGVPSVEWDGPVFDRETELFNPFLIQVDYWARGVQSARVIENRLRELTHRDVSRVFVIDGYNSIRLWTRYIDSRKHDYPADPGVVHRSLDFQFEPLRSRFYYS